MIHNLLMNKFYQTQAKIFHQLKVLNRKELNQLLVSANKIIKKSNPYNLTVIKLLQIMIVEFKLATKLIRRNQLVVAIKKKNMKK